MGVGISAVFHSLSHPRAGRGRVWRPGERLEPDTCIWGIQVVFEAIRANDIY